MKNFYFLLGFIILAYSWVGIYHQTFYKYELESILDDFNPQRDHFLLSSHLRKNFDSSWTYIKLDEAIPPTLYSRTLIYKGEKAEALILGWPPGVKSPIHDHPSQGCYMKVLRGQLKNVIYDLNERNESEVNINYELTHTLFLGNVAYLAGRNGIHHIENTGNVTAYSLHIYSPPDFYNLKVEGEKRKIYSF